MKLTIVRWLVALALVTFAVTSPCASAAQASAANPSAVSSNVYPIEEGYVDAHGEMIYYQIVGRGAPLVIVHGGPGASHDYFLPYLLTLARTNRLVFIDQRGSGRSQKLDDASGYNVENMVEDVEDVRVALNLRKISLLGHSYGGVLAQAYALKYQQNLRHLILASTFPSTAEMNQVFVNMKKKMRPAVSSQIDKLEAQGLFGHGKPWEQGRYTEEYMKLVWGDGYFPYCISDIRIPTTIRWRWGTLHGLFIARCGVRMGSSSLMAI